MTVVPTIGEPLVGWRSWRLARRYGQLVLVSQVVHTRWPRRRRMVAHCVGQYQLPPTAAAPRATVHMYRDATRTWDDGHPAHTSPVVEPRVCSSGHPCGIYALRGPEPPAPWVNWAPHPVEGWVYLWGVVVPHKNGWRAQYAYPRELVLRKGLQPDDDLELLALELEHGYGVPVRVEVLRKPGVEAKP